MKKYAFISHPFAGNEIENRNNVDAICRKLLDENIVPISPLHLFGFYSEDKDRGEIMEVCKYLIDMCDQVYVYGDSPGCNEELRYAIRRNKPVKILFGEAAAPTEDYMNPLTAALGIPNYRKGTL